MPQLQVVSTSSLQQRVNEYIEREGITKVEFSSRVGISNSDLYRILASQRLTKSMRARIEAVLDGRVIAEKALDPTMEKLMTALVNSAIANGRISGLVSGIYRAAESQENGIPESITLAIVRLLLQSIKNEDARLRVVMEMMSVVGVQKQS